MEEKWDLIGLHIVGTPKKAAIAVKGRKGKNEKDDYIAELKFRAGNRDTWVLLKGGDLYALAEAVMGVMKEKMNEIGKEEEK